MKFTHTLLAAGIAAAMTLGLSACNHSANQAANTAETPAGASTAAAPASAPAPMSTAAAPAAASTSAAAPASASSIATMIASNQQAGDNWFGGPIYNGKPDLAATAALVKAGGGADNFDFSTALVAMLGKDTVNKEVAKLTQQYGAKDVNTFVTGMTFAVKDALKRATEQGIKLPPPAPVKGVALAKALVQAGTAPDGTFWAGYLFDQALSHPLHNQVMADIDAGPGQAADATTHRILNQAMFDVAQAEGMKDVKLASFH